jgi:hypothetical protein
VIREKEVVVRQLTNVAARRAPRHSRVDTLASRGQAMRWKQYEIREESRRIGSVNVQIVRGMAWDGLPAPLTGRDNKYE